MESKVNKMPVGFLAAWENAYLYAPLQFLYLLVLQRQLSELLLLLKLRLFRAFFVAIIPLLLVISMLVVCGHAFLSRHVRKMKRRHKKRGITKNFWICSSSFNQISNRTTMVCLLLRVLLL